MGIMHFVGAISIATFNRQFTHMGFMHFVGAISIAVFNRHTIQHPHGV